jgi:hypothetical protein
MSKRRLHGPNRAHRPRAQVSTGGSWVAAEPRIRALLGRIDEVGLAWEDVADDVLPIFERATPSRYEHEPPARAVVPPGVSVGFAIDIGPAFARISTGHLDRWPVDLDDLTDRSLRNLRRRARHAQDYDLVCEPVDGVPTAVFQSRDGWASTAILIPEAIDRLFGPGPALFIVPSRDLLVGLPVDVDPEFATWLTEEFEAMDANALRLEAFEWRDGAIRCSPLRRDAVTV